MNNLNNKGRKKKGGTVVAVLVLIVLCCNILGGCGKEFEVSDYFFMSNTNTLPREYYETEYMGNIVPKTVCGKNVTAAYEKTIYKMLGDITKYSYKVTAVEGENDTSDLSISYVELNDNGDVIGGGGDFGYLDVKCRYDNEQDHVLKDGYSFGISKEALRVMAEEALGEVVEWSLYNGFFVEFSEPLEFLIGMKQTAYPIYTSAFLTWYQRITGEERESRQMSVKNTVRCTLNFASWDKNTGHTFFDKSYITEFHVETPLKDKENLSKYVDRVPIAVSSYWNKFEEHINENSAGGDSESGLTVYNGKMCYYQKSRSYTMIIPLE